MDSVHYMKTERDVMTKVGSATRVLWLVELALAILISHLTSYHHRIGALTDSTPLCDRTELRFPNRIKGNVRCG